MFLSNKYSRWYRNIIHKAQTESRKKGEGEYYENHHILPKSLGGNNDKRNLVLLTAKEHFICHILLVQMADNKRTRWKMLNAVLHMGHKPPQHLRKRYVNSRLYSICKQQISIAWQDEDLRREHGMKTGKKLAGRPKTDAHRKKIGDSNRGKGKTVTEAVIQARKEHSQRMTGRKHSLATIQKLRLNGGRKPKPVSYNDKIYPSITALADAYGISEVTARVRLKRVGG
jgi:hypothetical protein